MLAQQSLGNVGRKRVAAAQDVALADLGGKPAFGTVADSFLVPLADLAHALIIPTMVGIAISGQLDDRLGRRRECGMGIWKKPAGRGLAFMRDYQQDAMKTVPRWARVVRVGRYGVGMVGVDVEIHYMGARRRMWVGAPSRCREVQLQAGQDVFVVGPDTSSDSNHTTWILT